MARPVSTKTFAATACTVCVLAACGGEDDTTATGGTGAQAPAGGSGGTAAAGGGGGGGDTGGSGGEATNEAMVLLVVGNLADENRRFANFNSRFQSDPDKRESVVVVDEHCWLLDARVEGHDEGLPTGPSPGLITISGGELADLTLDPEGTGVDYSSMAGMWDAGEAVTASAPGDELPAIAVELAIPTELELTSPDLQNAAPDEITIDLTSPYELTWTPTDGTVEAELFQGSNDPGGPGSIGLVCRFPGGSGVGTLPVEGLAELVPGSVPLYVAHLITEEDAFGPRPFLFWAGNWHGQSVVLE